MDSAEENGEDEDDGEYSLDDDGYYYLDALESNSAAADAEEAVEACDYCSSSFGCHEDGFHYYYYSRHFLLPPLHPHLDCDYSFHRYSQTSSTS